MEMPNDLVTLDDIRDRFYRALTPDEERVVPAWISDAWDELLDMPALALEARLTADPPEAGLSGAAGGIRGGVASTATASTTRRCRRLLRRRLSLAHGSRMRSWPASPRLAWGRMLSRSARTLGCLARSRRSRLPRMSTTRGIRGGVAYERLRGEDCGGYCARSRERGIADARDGARVAAPRWSSLGGRVGEHDRERD